MNLNKFFKKKTDQELRNEIRKERAELIKKRNRAELEAEYKELKRQGYQESHKGLTNAVKAGENLAGKGAKALWDYASKHKGKKGKKTKLEWF